MKQEQDIFSQITAFHFEKNGLSKPYQLQILTEKNPSSRLLTVLGDCNESYVIKTPKRQNPSPSDIFHMRNEVLMHQVLNKLGIPAKQYVWTDLSADNKLGIPFMISTYIKGDTLEDATSQDISKIIPKAFGYVYSLHSQTRSNTFGYIEPSPGHKEAKSFGEFESKYFLNDISRSQIPFSKEEMDHLYACVERLDESKLYCLTHCDITQRNALINKDSFYLIDWEYAHNTDPSFDLANLIFWLNEYGLYDQLESSLKRSYAQYSDIGFDILQGIDFFLIQRYIEFGRHRGQSYIDKGKRLLSLSPTFSVAELVENIHQIITP